MFIDFFKEAFSDGKLLLANALSLIAFFFTTMSSWAKDRRSIYMYQVGQCAVLSLASFFFGSYAGISTLLVCAVRNYLLAIDRFYKKECIISIILMLVLGVATNNNGMTGALIIAANIIYTIGTFLCRRELTIKINIIIDLILWMIYEVLIIDIPSFVSDLIGLIVAVISIFRIKKSE